jgi:hypothetical protein
MAIVELRGYPGLPLEEARVLQDTRGAIAVWARPSGLLVTRALGKMTAAHARQLEAGVDAILRRTPRHVAFHDWEDLTDYEIEARLRLTQLAIRLRDVSEVHLVVRSRLIVAAVDAAGAILKNLQLYASRAELERALLVHSAKHPV